MGPGGQSVQLGDGQGWIHGWTLRQVMVPVGDMVRSSWNRTLLVTESFEEVTELRVRTRAMNGVQRKFILAIGLEVNLLVEVRSREGREYCSDLYLRQAPNEVTEVKVSPIRWHIIAPVSQLLDGPSYDRYFARGFSRAVNSAKSDPLPRPLHKSVFSGSICRCEASPGTRSRQRQSSEL